ncbi:hypothetical protein K461DRAFT_145694 [Myriangium duriaei CBS 260.36]|uniref:Uncharacterized protein n=1 Tax=Myriangium duriaei CBS 260.36 TaxID=1168546 RepID=A0A9P4IYS2_9PEZI|nr:hypothetical protein K461DRAFT_145694 [Myriangium duriaei CBS 260.36]
MPAKVSQLLHYESVRLPWLVVSLQAALDDAREPASRFRRHSRRYQKLTAKYKLHGIGTKAGSFVLWYHTKICRAIGGRQMIGSSRPRSCAEIQETARADPWNSCERRTPKKSKTCGEIRLVGAFSGSPHHVGHMQRPAATIHKVLALVTCLNSQSSVTSHVSRITSVRPKKALW